MLNQLISTALLITIALAAETTPSAYNWQLTRLNVTCPEGSPGPGNVPYYNQCPFTLRFTAPQITTNVSCIPGMTGTCFDPDESAASQPKCTVTKVDACDEGDQIPTVSLYTQYFR
jgi:hypothetical protein